MDLQLAPLSGKIRGFRAAKLTCCSAQLIDGIDVTSQSPSLGRRASEGTLDVSPSLARRVSAGLPLFFPLKDV